MMVRLRLFEKSSLWHNWEKIPSSDYFAQNPKSSVGGDGSSDDQKKSFVYGKEDAPTDPA